MTKPESHSKVTVSEAAKALNVTKRTIYRWIEKGLLVKSKDEEDKNKYYVVLQDVKNLCDKIVSRDIMKTKSVTVSDANHVTLEKLEKSHFLVEKSHYEGLLVKLGQFEAEKRYLLEYKTGIEEKNKELEETRERLKQLDTELAKWEYLPWWKKIFR